ncbi:amidohydrolase [Allofournierella sp.]|uniref:amidohydrolase n=1 Tax=Allofournierella sp. TaxID=1940256 RepID=UPI003AF16C6C
MNADLILKSNSIFLGKGQPISGVVAVAGGRIAYVGPADQAPPLTGPNTRTLELGGQLVMPGFHDAHLHIHMSALMFSKYMFMMLENTSEQDCIERMRPFVATRPKGAWVVTCGWYLPFWGEGAKLPTRASLDAAYPDWPVCMSSGDGHTAWLNSRALEALGITDDTPNPAGGEFVRDENGHLTGVAKEMAGTKVYAQVLNGFTEAEIKDAYASLFAQFREYGITSVCDLGATSLPGADLLHPELLEEFLAAGKLTFRAHLFPTMTKDMARPKMMREKYTHPKLCWRGVKQFLDGVSSTHTAYLSEPYANAWYPGDRGQLTVAEANMDELVYLANKNGMSMRIHTIGDGAIHAGLNAYEKAQKALGKDPAIQNTLEHLENIRQGDIRRLAELGVMASMQPAHSMIDPAGIEADLGLERTKLMWAFRDMLDAGVRLAFGTDVPTAALNPIENVSYAVTRQNTQGLPQGGWEYHQHISLSEALEAYTWGSACAVRRQHELGALAEGMLADITVLDRDLFAIPEGEIKDAQVVLTILDGEIVYQR